MAVVVENKDNRLKGVPTGALEVWTDEFIREVVD
jgi:hypothetical protein